MAPRSKSTERIILGIPELDKLLELMKQAVANKCARAGLTKGARLGAKLVKAKVPGSQKSIRKAIGHSVKKQKSGPNRGYTSAKFGAAVGKKGGTQADRVGKDGVGISAANVHLWILGTAERTVRKTGQRAGKMPANPIVVDAMASGKGAVIEAVKEGTLASIEREAQKLAKQVKHAN